MKITNKIIFIGFIVSGGFFFTAMLLSNLINEGHWLRDSVIPFMIGFGVFFGWCFTVAGLLNVIFGVAFKMSGRLSSFWKSLYPVNFGLAILAMLIVSGAIGL